MHFGGRLFQEYIIRAYLAVEFNDLCWIKFNQGKINAENYDALKKYVEKKARDEEARVGRKVILPSTFQGSARDYRQRFHDAMSVVVSKGKPDLFITMTCNPHWP